MEQGYSQSLGRMASNIASTRGGRVSSSASPSMGGDTFTSDQQYGSQYQQQAPSSQWSSSQGIGAGQNLGGQQQYGTSQQWQQPQQSQWQSGLGSQQQLQWQQGQGKWALITGASTGIGYEFAKQFAQYGYNLILVGRDQNELFIARDEINRQFSNVRTVIILRDLAHPTGARDLYEELRNQNLVVDVLVSNAGQCLYGKFLEVDLEKHVNLIWLTIYSTVTLTYLLGRDMMQRGRGKIILMSGLHAVAPNPLHAVWAACLKFVKMFSAALSYELSNTGVTVTCLLPGYTSGTKLFMHSGSNVPRAYRGWFPLISPDLVAKTGITAAFAGKCLAVPGWYNWFFFHASKFIPNEILMMVFKYLNCVN